MKTLIEAVNTMQTKLRNRSVYLNAASIYLKRLYVYCTIPLFILIFTTAR